MFAHWRPAEDFARGALTFRDAEGHEVMVEATNSWAYVGAGLRPDRAPRPGIFDGVLLAQNEPDIYGYIGEDRHMVEAFRHRRQPMETFHDGIAVAEIAAEAQLLPVIATRMAKSVASMEIRSSVPAQDLWPQLCARLR
jgi:hypothetical protein